MKALFRPRKPPKDTLRRVLKKFRQCLENYDYPSNDIAYWYGERALTGLLASAAWMVRGGWSLEEFTGQRQKGRRKNASGKGDLWLGFGNREYTIEAKVTWPTQLKDVSKWVKTVSGKLAKAAGQLKALDKDYQCGVPVAVSYVVPAIPSGSRGLTSKMFSSAMRRFAKLMTEKNAQVEVVACWLNNITKAPRGSSPNENKVYVYPGIAVVLRYREIWKFPKR